MMKDWEKYVSYKINIKIIAESKILWTKSII